jgi:hypothetical protein
MLYDFSTVGEVHSFASIPAGSYACRIAEVREGRTRDGSVRWAMRLEVAEGEYAGRTAGWDGLIWSERGILRVKRVLEILGYDVQGEVQLSMADLEGRLISARFEHEDYEDPATGQRTASLSVPYAGYEAFESLDLRGEEVLREPSPEALDGSA